MRSMIWIVFALAVAPCAAADDLPALGSKLRVMTTTTGDRLIVGKLLAADEATLTLDIGADRLQISRPTVTRLDVARGRSRGHGALKGAALGALGGFVGGVLMGDDDPHTFLAFTGPEKGVMLAILATPVGALIGLAGGGEHWEPVARERVQLSLVPLPRGGAYARVAVSF